MSGRTTIPFVKRAAIIAMARCSVAPAEIRKTVAPDWPLQRVHNVLAWARRCGVPIPKQGRTGNTSPIAKRRAEIIALAVEGNSPTVIRNRLQLPVGASCVSNIVCEARKAGAPIPHFRSYIRFAEPRA